MRWPAPSGRLVRAALDGHGLIGLAVAAALYLLCLTGTVAVYYQAFERWEQPNAPELHRIDARALDRALDLALNRVDAPAPRLFVGLPSAALPRAVVSGVDQGWFVTADGGLGERVSHPFTHLLLDLHIYLTLPGVVGLTLVGVLGVALCALSVSGLIAHPRVFKDAFLLRLGGSPRLARADLHNRLSVWSLPFQLMIGITGAYFGVATLVLMLAAALFFDGDRDAARAAVFGERPLAAATGPAAPPRLAAALDDLAQRAPGMQPIYLIVHDAGTPAQMLEVAARDPGRLIYAEHYFYTPAGQFLGTQGTADGPVGRQAVYATYRLHFGDYGGALVKPAYVLLGFALSVVCVTGVGIWLARRQPGSRYARAWAGLVWGAPLCLAALAVCARLTGSAPATLFWIGLGGCVAWALRQRSVTRVTARLQLAAAAVLGILVAAVAVAHGAAAAGPAAAGVNAALLTLAVVLTVRGWHHGRCKTDPHQPAAQRRTEGETLHESNRPLA